jgi:hypothetical protein
MRRDECCPGFHFVQSGLLAEFSCHAGRRTGEAHLTPVSFVIGPRALGYPLAWLGVIASGLVPLLWFEYRGWFD